MTDFHSKVFPVRRTNGTARHNMEAAHKVDHVVLPCMISARGM
jgi:hypothetical protein